MRSFLLVDLLVKLNCPLLILHDFHVEVCVLLLLLGICSILRVRHLVLGLLVHLLLLGKSLIRMHHWPTTRHSILTELRLCSYVSSIRSLHTEI